MNEYLKAIIVISVVSGIFEILSPNSSGIGKYTRMICLLCILCVVITPIKSLFENFNSGFLDDLKEELIDREEDQENYEELLKDYLNKHSASELKDYLKSQIEKRFEIPYDECNIILHTEKQNEGIEVIRIDVILSGKSIFKNPYEIEEYISEQLNCECIVTIK